MLGLGSRRPGDVMITPQGFLTLGSLSGCDGPGDFASRGLSHELMSPLGFPAVKDVVERSFSKVYVTQPLSPLMYQLITQCRDCLLALRRCAMDIIVPVGCALVRLIDLVGWLIVCLID